MTYSVSFMYNVIIFYVDYYSPALVDSKCVLQGVGQKLSTTVGVHRLQKKYFRLHPDHLEWADSYVVLKMFCLHHNYSGSA